MRFLTRATGLALILLAGVMPAIPGANAATPPSPEAGAPTGKLTNCFIKGVEERVHCATLKVPLKYDQPDGDKIDLHITVVPTDASNPAPDPLFVFAGGPGQAASDYGALMDTAFKGIRALRDIVLIDNRGTGLSTPLKCDTGDGVGMQAMAVALTSCIKHQTVDVRYFTHEAVVKDADAVRAFLGVDKINIWGVSYGTRTAALYLRRYPEHVRALILDGILPPTVPLLTSAPQSAERAKEKMAEACKASPACMRTYGDLNKQVDELVARARAGKLHYKGNDPFSGAPLDVKIDADTVSGGIRGVMYMADATTTLPYAVDAANSGNLGPLIAGLNGGSGTMESLFMGATLSILCGEELPRVTPDQAREAAKDSFTGDSDYRFWATACRGWPTLPPAADAMTEIHSDVPLLALSGNLDPVTPPNVAAKLVQDFPNSLHVIVPGNGHVSSMAGCVPRLMADFLKKPDPKALDAKCAAQVQRLPFITGLNGTVN